MTKTAEAKPQSPAIGATDSEESPGPITLVRNLNELFNTGQEGEISFVRGFLRCLGHSAAGTSVEFSEIPDDDLDFQLPPVNPWKLIKSLSKATVSKKHRREMMARIGEDMAIGDQLGLLAVLAIYGEAKDDGLSKDEAQNKAWGWYEKLASEESKRKE